MAPAPPAGPSRTSSLWALGIAVVVVVVLPNVPLVSLLVRPFVWLSTLMHEGGHAAASLLVGGGCDKLQVFFDTSGLMTRARGVDAPWKDAAISLGGLIGPAIASAFFCAAGVVPAVARAALVVTGVVCVAVAALFADGFGVFVCLGWGAVFVAAGVFLAGLRASIAVLVFAVDLAGSVFSRSDYLFAATARTASGELPSDVANIARALGGHHLLWGTGIAMTSVILLAAGVFVFLAGDHLLVRWSARRSRAMTAR